MKFLSGVNTWLYLGTMIPQRGRGEWSCFLVLGKIEKPRRGREGENDTKLSNVLGLGS